MGNPVNKSIDKFIEKKIERYILLNKDAVSVVTCTNKPYALENILNNFNRQAFEDKELIIIINNNKIDEDKWSHGVSEYENIRVFKLDEDISLGRCLNFGVQKSKYGIVAKFDDDDYYGSKYLLDSIKVLRNTGAGLVGKHTIFVYFQQNKILAIKDSGFENQHTSFLNGATMVFRKEIFKKVCFRDISVDEDVFFCRDCIENEIKVYSGNRYHFVYLRHSSQYNHTWRISNMDLLNLYCTYIGKVDDFRQYVDI